MAHQDVVDTLRVEVKFRNATTNAENIFHVRTDAAPVPADLESARGVFQAWLLSDWAPIANENWAAVELVITDLSSITGQRRSYPISPIISGLVAGDALPANATLAIKADTGTRGRGKNGRSFFVGISESSAEGDTVSAAFASNIVTAFEALRTSVEAVAAFTGLAIPHLVVAGVRPPLATSSIVLHYVLADVTIDSQRDRLPGHKKHKRRTP
jgi:hypothetical protein